MAQKQNFFDSRARDWEATCYPEPVRARLRKLIKAFGVRRGEHVLDVGTGPGVLIPYLRSLTGSTGRIYAFDFSHEMAKQANRKQHASGNIVIRADVHQIPFGDNAFDRVICFAAFPHFHNPGQAIFEMARVLKPEGELIITHLMSREELARHHGRHEAVARDLLPDDREMTSFFLQAMLSSPKMINQPGRYLARGWKKYERNG
jgi:ubiquinone/menaquinone biosynthesis C-methylase UbiE